MIFYVIKLSTIFNFHINYLNILKSNNIFNNLLLFFIKKLLNYEIEIIFSTLLNINIILAKFVKSSHLLNK